MKFRVWYNFLYLGPCATTVGYLLADDGDIANYGTLSFVLVVTE